MTRGSALTVVLLAIAVALALRVPGLATRPLHNDEAVNAVKVSELWEQGRYVYDPHEYHGPTLHYLTVPLLWLGGAGPSDQWNDAVLRVAPVVFGVGLILLLLLFADGLGRPALLWSALFLAISPAMVFYSRYFIHEMLLVFFTALTLGAGWRYTQTRSAGWAVVAGTGLGLMVTTKETFVITLAAMALAGVVLAWWTMPGGNVLRSVRENWNWKHAALALGAAFALWLVLFSSFFTNASGPLDSVRTYLPWLQRAGGQSPHIHPWYFYLERLVWFHPVKGPAWSEGLIVVLAVVGMVVSLARRQASPLARYLALYTIGLTAAYSAIAYKTPWCLLGFYHGMILLAGVGATWLIDLARTRALKVFVGVLLAGLTAQLSWQAWRSSFVYAADRRNPYVYAQTVPDLLNLVKRAEGLAGVAPTGFETIVKVIAPEGDYWPLPWYLRRFEQVGWYEKLPDDPFAPIVVASSKLGALLDEKSGKKWLMVGLFEMRPKVFFELYVELELWKKYVETLPRERE